MHNCEYALQELDVVNAFFYGPQAMYQAAMDTQGVITQLWE